MATDKPKRVLTVVRDLMVKSFKLDAPPIRYTKYLHDSRRAVSGMLYQLECGHFAPWTNKKSSSGHGCRPCTEEAKARGEWPPKKPEVEAPKARAKHDDVALAALANSVRDIATVLQRLDQRMTDLEEVKTRPPEPQNGAADYSVLKNYRPDSDTVED